MKARILTAIVAGLLVAGCTLVPEATEISLYELPGSQLQPSEASLPWSLRVNAPAANDALNSRRLLVLEDGSQLTTFGAARWVSPTPTLLRDHLAEAFLSDGRLRAVTTDRDSLGADRELTGHLRRFYTVAGNGAPSVVITFDATLADTASREIVASQRFQVSEDISRADAASAVAAFGLAADRLARELLLWMAAAGAD